MRGAAQLVLLALYIGQLLAPALIIADFIVDRERIERELCVQRERAADVRTCHGECHMVKQLRAAEEAAAQHAPPALPMKVQPEWFVDRADEPVFGEGIDLHWPRIVQAVPAGERAAAEPVPWG
ncbi:MAG: hypothetical protein IPG74_18730 [Flavobacteriales bacterium]|nr:hypothetical protein [Flavobacteriales bacterium]MBK7553364.1 hypothetical protein [Flavobacteriales bacterium]MBK9194980.1 hypothetical protein [Flavobacteriales bacterium]